jgi:hypothetical protein
MSDTTESVDDNKSTGSSNSADSKASVNFTELQNSYNSHGEYNIQSTKKWLFWVYNLPIGILALFALLSTCQRWVEQGDEDVATILANNVFYLLPFVLTIQHALELMGMYVYKILPGYCYLTHFRTDDWKEVANECGQDPLWETICKHPKFDGDIKFEYYHTRFDPWTIHTYPDPKGSSGSSMLDKLNGLRVGRKFNVIGKFRIATGLTFVQQICRITLWIYILMTRTWIDLLIVVPVAVVLLLLKLDYLLACGIISITAGLTMTNVQILLMGVGWVLTHLTTYYLYYGMWVGEWKVPDLTIPYTTAFPTGITASKLTHRFLYQNVNNNIEHTTFRDYEDVTAEERAVFMEETGLDDTQPMRSGNPHRLAAMISRYFKWFLPSTHYEPFYTIIIGGTFKGWGCAVTGAAIQPNFSDTDAATINGYPTRPGYGQQVIVDHIATDCGPVDADDEKKIVNWDPHWGVTGLEGAVMVMTHVYDIPIKALLAVADHNNTKTCYVMMHACPDLFIKRTGRIPWTHQYWTDTGDGTLEFRFDDTSGRTWKTNKRLVYEHFFTEYVQTTNGVYYVSDIYRQVMDVYFIRWTRTETKPVTLGQRQIKCKFPHKDVLIPKASYEPNDTDPSIEFMWAKRIMEEYLHKAEDIGTIGTSFRALTDSMDRNQNIRINYPNHNEIVAIWKAELCRRELVDIAGGGRHERWEMNVFNQLLVLLGIKPDTGQIEQVATKLLELLKEQPTRKVTMKTIKQETPYVKTKRVRLCVERRIPMFHCAGAAGTIVTQKKLDETRVTTVQHLDGFGNNIAERLLDSIFNKTRDIGPILPLGEPGRGGSVMGEDGTRLTATEIEYLINEANIIVLKTEFDEDGVKATKCFAGPVDEEDRPAIVHIDFTTNRVSRIHYPMRTNPNRVIMMLNATKSDLASDNEWVDNLGGSARTYIAFNDYDRAYKSCQLSAIQKSLYEQYSQKGGPNTEVINKLVDDGENLHDFVDLPINAGMNYNQIPVVANSIHYPQYDLLHPIVGSEYPPPHKFYNWSVENMRKIRRT